MNATVIAAAIGVGGTVLVGVAGFGAAIWNTRRTIAHARENRIWDRRADTYVQALAALRQWRTEMRISTDGPEQVQAMLDKDSGPHWDELGPRLEAFASEPVFTAVNAAQWAHVRAMIVVRRSRDAESETPLAAEDAHAAWQEWTAADDAAVQLIRTELQGKARPIDDSPPDYVPPSPSRR